MNGETEYKEGEEEEVNNGLHCETVEVLSSLKNSPIPVNENETEEIPGECESNLDQENPGSTSGEPTVDEADFKPTDSSEDCFQPVKGSTNEGLKVNNQEISNQEDSVDNNSNNQPAANHSETLQCERSASPAHEAEGRAGEEEEEEEGELAAVDLSPCVDINYEEYMHLLEELLEEKEEVSQRNSQLQVKLAEYLRRKTREDLQLDREIPVSEQQQEYERCMDILSERKQQFAAETEAAQQKTEELRLLSQENLEKVVSLFTFSVYILIWENARQLPLILSDCLLYE